MVYGRQHGDQELSFEASGGLLDASLVMRDRETDSWWSIMTSDAIGGELEGTGMPQVPHGEKMPWGDWERLHPGTKVLSVDGVEHDQSNPYDNYFTSEDTFRNSEVSDTRLKPKALIFSFWHGDRPYAVSHSSYRSGALIDLSADSDHVLLLHRHAEDPIYASSEAYLIPRTLAQDHSVTDLLALARAEESGIQRQSGFDTFWYTWVAVNQDTELIDLRNDAESQPDFRPDAQSDPQSDAG